MEQRFLSSWLFLRYRIGPFEVESVLLEHPSVAESAVVASPDDLRGQIVKAFIVLTSQGVDSIEEKFKFNFGLITGLKFQFD